MNMNKLEYKKYELTCVSPVHIGSGEKLRAFEYLYDRERQEAHFLDEGKWIRFLARHGLMDSFAAYLEQTAKAMGEKGPFLGENVWEWLRRKDIPEDEIRSLAARTALAATNTVDPEGRGTLNEISCQMALSDGRPYIPGSSIKGALRTALIYRIIRENEKLRTRYWGRLERAKPEARREAEEKVERILRRSVGKPRRTQHDPEAQVAKECNKIFAKKLRQVSQGLETECFSRLDYSSAKKWNGEPLPVTNEVKSALRGLQVGDASPVDAFQKTVILQKIDAFKRADVEGIKETRISLFRECLPAGAKLAFSVTFDKSMMKTVGVESLDALFSCARDFAQESMAPQKEIFGAAYKGEFSEAETAGLLLGGGVGFHAKSMISALAPTPEDARKFIADYLEQTFKTQGHDHATLDTRISPRTLKLTRDRNFSHIMGLCEVVPC